MTNDSNGMAGDEWATVHDWLTAELDEEGSSGQSIVDVLEKAEEGFKQWLKAEDALAQARDELARIKEGGVIEGRLTPEQNLVVDNALYENNSYTKGNDLTRTFWREVAGEKHKLDERLMNSPYYKVYDRFNDARMPKQTNYQMVKAALVEIGKAIRAYMSP